MITTLLLLLPLAQSTGLEEAMAKAEALGAQGNLQGAVQCLEDAGVEDARNAAAMEAYGKWKMRLTEQRISSGRIRGLEAYDAWLDVARVFEQAARLPGATDYAWENWSEAVLNGNDLKNALRIAEDGLSEFRDSARLFQQRGRVLMALAREARGIGDDEAAAEYLEQAERAFRDAMKVAPEQADPCVRLGELLWTKAAQGGEGADALRAQAVDAWLAAVERDPAGVDGGHLYQWLGTESIPVFDALIEAQPDEVMHYWYRGMAHHASGPEHWPQLRDDFQKVLEINPQFKNAYYFLADGAMTRGAWRAQQDDQETADEAYAKAAEYWAEYLRGFGDTYRAQLASAEDGGRGAAENMNWLAGKVRDLRDGIVLLEWTVKTVPDFGDAWNNLAFFYRETRQYEKSRDAYARALELMPDDPQVMNDYAVIFHYYLKTEDEKALSLYERARDRAQEMLDAGTVPEEDLQRIRIALRDAKNNLAKLRKGNRENR